MSYSNRDLMVFYISYKLSQRNYLYSHFGLTGSSVDGAAEGTKEGKEQVEGLASGPGNANGSVNGWIPELPPPSLRSLEMVKEALWDSANEFGLRYSCVFSDLSSQLHIMPGTPYQSFENVMNEVFRHGVNWGRVVSLFAFGGALCVECLQKEMSHLVGRIADLMTVYLDNHIQPWIQRQGGWVNGTVADFATSMGFSSDSHMSGGIAVVIPVCEPEMRLLDATLLGKITFGICYQLECITATCDL